MYRGAMRAGKATSAWPRTLGTAKCSANKPMSGIPYCFKGSPDTVNKAFQIVTPLKLGLFERGFEARCQANTSIEIYYNLESFVHGVVEHIYRYEIYAPGGILVPKTLGDCYPYRGQAEVAFPGGIAPRYIRSAQPFLLSRDGLYPKCIRANDILYLNGNFDPNLDPQREIKVSRVSLSHTKNTHKWSSNNLTDITVSLPTEGLTMEERAGLVNALKSKLKIIGGTDLDVLENLKPAVRKRVDVLRDIQSEHDELEAKFFEERAALEAKCQKLYALLYSKVKRYDYVNLYI
ncbi:nucleosome assembly protein 1;4-like protein isoform X2 [Tanacetum coccineum]